MTEVKILKTHSLFINRVSFKNQVSVTGFSVNCGQNYTLQSEHSINFSQILNISTIDCINADHQVIDSQVIVNFYGFQINHISHIGSIIFDMRVEKIVKPNDELRKKQFTNGNGFIQYKFIGLNSTNISSEQMDKYLVNKDKIVLMNSCQKQRQSFDEFMKIISEKDQIIEYLETKTKDLIQEKKKLNKIINKKQIQVQKYSKQKLITLNVKFHQKSLQQIQHFPSQISRENIQRQYLQNIQSQIKTGSKLDSKKESGNDRHSNIFRNRIPNNSMIYHESIPKLQSLQQYNTQSALNSPRKNSGKNSPRKNSKLNSTRKNDLLQQKDQKIIKFEDQGQQQQEKNILNELENQKIKLIKKLQIQSKEMGILRKKLQNKEKKIENLLELNKNHRGNLRNHLERNSLNVQENFEEVKFQNEHLNEENDLLKSEIKNLEEQLALKIENSYHQNQQNEELKKLQYTNQKQQNKIKQLQSKNKNISINYNEQISKVQIIDSQRENLRNKLIEKEKQIIRLKDIEFNYQLCKKNIQRLQMSNGKFEVQTMKLESLLQNEPKNTNDENINTKNNIIYKRNLKQRIDAMEQKLCQFQKEYYGQILSSLEQQKKNIINSYSMKINSKNQNSLNSDINNKSKQILQEEMKRYIDVIELKISKIKESLSNNFVRNDLVVQDKIKIMDQKMGVILSEIHSLGDDKKSGKMSKTVINQINSNLNQRQNKVQKSQFTGLKSVNDQQNLFVQETSNYNNYRESMIGQMNKNKELYTKSFDQLRKHNRELLKQKSQLQLEIQNYKFKENKLVSKHQQRQDNLQKMAKQTENQHHMIQEKQNKAIEQMSNKYEQVELQNQQYHKSMVNLIEQLKNVSNQLEKEIAYNGKQQLQNQKLYQRTIRYEQAQSILIKEVRQIKQKANFNEENFSRLFEQRNQQFLKIEKIKSTEIQKLKGIIFQLEEQIEGQVLENINLNIEKQKKNTENTVLLEKINQLQEFIALNNENNQNKNIQLSEKIQQISVHNEILEKNLVQIAEQIRSKEIEIEEYNCQNRSLKLQNDSLLNLKQDLLQLQKNHSKQKQELQQIISNQTNEIKKIESNYIAIEEKIKKVINQNQEINHKNKQLSSEIQQLNINFSNSQIHLKRIIYEKELLQAQIKNYEMKKNNQTITNDILIKRLNKIEDQISGIQNNDQISQKQIKSRFLIKSKRTPLNKNKSEISRLKSSISNKQIYDRKQKDTEHFLKPQSVNSGNSNSVIDIDIVDIQKCNSSYSVNIHKNVQKDKKSQINFNYEQIQDSIQIQSKEQLMKAIEKKNQKSILKDDNNCFQNSSLIESIEIENQKENSFQDSMKQQIRRLKEQIEAFKKKNQSLANEIGKKNQKISQLLIELENFKSQKDSNQLRKSFRVEQSRKISEEINKFKVDSIHGNIDKQKFDQAQLYIQELKSEVDNLTKELKEENSNNKKLLEATDELLDDRDCFHQKYQQMKILLKQSKQNYQEELAVMQLKIDNFVLENLQKENQMTKIVTNLAIIKQENERNLLKIIQLSQNNQKKITQIIKINNEKKKMKEQYCKYEQQAETQIFQLKQSIDQLKNSIQLKDQELLLLGDNYCSLEQKLIQTEKIISQSSDQSQKMQWHLSQFKKKYENLNHVINEKQKKQSDLQKKMKEIEVEKTKLEQSLSTIHKNSVMTMKKQTIQSQIQIKQKIFCQNQIQDKDKQINNLKNQLGLYNQKTLELQNVNRQLSYELDKVEKELKDIMKAYEMEFCNLQNNQNTMMRIKQSSEKQLKEKNQEIRQIMKLYKQKDQIITQQEQELKNFKKAYQNYKTSKQTQLSQKNMQIQLTKDQYEKYKKSYEIAEEKFVLKECKFLQEQEKSQMKIKSMKQKLLKYQQNIQQLQKEFQEYNKKPTQEQFQQLCFTNEQYRLKIKELEENEEQSNINRENMMYLEFRKYKVFKEGQLQDLENQMEKYGNKINQLQQLNYYMKKDLQKCRVELKIMLQNKEQLQQENQDLLDDLESIKSELQFYKARKLEDLSKLLNQTDD